MKITKSWTLPLVGLMFCTASLYTGSSELVADASAEEVSASSQPQQIEQVETPSTTIPVVEEATPDTAPVVEEVVEEEATLPIWEDRANPVQIVIPKIGTQASIEPAVLNADGVYDPSNSAVAMMDFKVDPCEIGSTWLLGHSNKSGALPGMVITPGDPADENVDHDGLQIDDIIEFILEDGTSCEYEVVEFGQSSSGELVAGSPARSWNKEQTRNYENHPAHEFNAQPGEGVLWLSTSGSWPMVNNHRPNLDVIKAVLVK